ncbi:MAG: A/G-specific adenine glycosylase [Bacteroidales bacterium]
MKRNLNYSLSTKMNITYVLDRWYDENSRELPWRNTNDPYKIWVSEIILQQTRVNQGLEYYKNFIKKFPDVHALGKSSLDEILKVWQGLGYYNRAKHMHETSKIIDQARNGKFPSNYKELLKLKGIGEYTAAAIASFAFNEPIATIDGNIQRFITRLYGIDAPVNSRQGKKRIQELSANLLNKNNPGKHNQAMIEFGAIHCKPKQPKCNECPFHSICVAYQKNLIHQLPVKSQTPKKTNRYFNFLIIRHRNKVFLEKRNSKNIWKNLYQFPLIESSEREEIAQIMQTDKWKQIFSDIQPDSIDEFKEYKHVLTHQNLYARFYLIKTRTISEYLKQNFIEINLSMLNKYPIPRLIERFLEEEKI